MPELDTLIAGVIGLVTGASPAVLHAVWRYCNKRSDQRHERHLRELEIREQAVKQGIQHNYDIIGFEPDGFLIQSIVQVNQQQAIHEDSQPPSGSRRGRRG